MGLITKEEAEDIQDAEIVGDTPKKSLTELAAEAAGVKEEAKEEDNGQPLDKLFDEQ